MDEDQVRASCAAVSGDAGPGEADRKGTAPRRRPFVSLGPKSQNPKQLYDGVSIVAFTATTSRRERTAESARSRDPVHGGPKAPRRPILCLQFFAFYARLIGVPSRSLRSPVSAAKH